MNLTPPQQRLALYGTFEACLRLISPDARRMFENLGILLMQDINKARAAIGPRGHALSAEHHLTNLEFLVAVVRLKGERCLVESIVWSYRTLLARNTDPAILGELAAAWREAVARRIGPRTDSRHLECLFEAIEQHHEPFLRLAQAPEPAIEVPPPYRAPFEAFVDAMLEADPCTADDVVHDRVRTAADIPLCWEEVIAPALRRIGRLWALAEIDESQEHIATSIAFQVMAQALPRLPRPPDKNQTVAVLVSPGEMHEMGATMVRDTLELAGYRVLFSGAKTPPETVVPIVVHNDVSCLLVSTTLTANLTGTSELIERLRRGTDRPLPVVVGGQAYTWDGQLWTNVGADAYEVHLRGILGRLATLSPADAPRPAG